MDYTEFAHDVRTKIRNIYDATDVDAPTVSSHIVCKKCKKPQIKPATVLYGKQLPPNVFECLMEDFNGRDSNVDLMIIAGTSLTVQPAAGWVTSVPPGIHTDNHPPHNISTYTPDSHSESTSDSNPITNNHPPLNISSYTTLSASASDSNAIIIQTHYVTRETIIDQSRCCGRRFGSRFH